MSACRCRSLPANPCTAAFRSTFACHTCVSRSCRCLWQAALMRGARLSYSLHARNAYYGITD